jgi:hypothetical protein
MTLPALKGRGFPSPLTGGSSVPPIYSGLHLSSRGANGVARTPPGITLILSFFKALFLMFSFPMTSLSASNPHLGHLSLLYPVSSSFESHFGHSDDVPFGFTMARGTPCFSACQSIHLPSLEYPIIMSFLL